MTIDVDIAMIGGGYRATTFLAATPSIFKKSLCLIESRQFVGAGSFQDLDAVTNSRGADFFRCIHPKGPFGWIFSDPTVGAVANNDGPIRIDHLAFALCALGSSVASEIKLHRGRVLIDDVVSVGITPGGRSVIRCRSGIVVRAKFCVLATGREEIRFSFGVPGGVSRVWLSSEVLSPRFRCRIIEHLRALSGKSIGIVGSSHSAFSVLDLLCTLIERIKLSDVTYVVPRINVIQRSAVRLYYKSLQDAKKNYVAGRERIFTDADVCNSTGEVFRYSGLRNRSKDIFCKVRRDEIANVSLLHAHPSTLPDLLKGMEFVVQATGYRARIPKLVVDGLPACAGSISYDHEGIVQVKGCALNVAAIKVEPSSRAHAPIALDDPDLYRQLAQRIM